jgi:hypothetical protein
MNQWIDKGEIALWPDKEATGKQPVVRGKVTIDNVEYTLSLWRSTSENPQAPTYWGKVQLKAGGSAPPPQQRPLAPEPPPDFDDDIPF